MRKIPDYEGFELGPIRPPSEAYSLLLRINRKLRKIPNILHENTLTILV